MRRKLLLSALGLLALAVTYGCSGNPAPVSTPEQVGADRGVVILQFVSEAQATVIGWNAAKKADGTPLLSDAVTRAILDKIEKPGETQTVVGYSEKLMVLLRTYHATHEPGTLGEIQTLLPLLEGVLREAFHVEIPNELLASVQRLIANVVGVVQQILSDLHPVAFVYLVEEVA